MTDETREVMSCGHLLSSVVTADEGTSYCAECQREATMSDETRDAKPVAAALCSLPSAAATARSGPMSGTWAQRGSSAIDTRRGCGAATRGDIESWGRDALRLARRADRILDLIEGREG